MSRRFRGRGIIAMFALLGIVACHASDTDPAGQAGELSDPVRRENAIFNLKNIYAKTLSDNGGDRGAADVRAVTDAIVEPLSKTYIENPQDRTNGLAILDLLQEVRDPRSVDAMIAALDWRNEVSEEHAIRAAQTLRTIDVPDGRKADVVKALSTSLGKITGARAVDNKMRIAMIRALGSLKDRGATDILMNIATKQDANQNFLINRLAGAQLGELGDPAAIPALIKCLFLFAENRPDMRMNDVAAEALVRIGRPALKPLLKVIGGGDKGANAIAKKYIATIKARRPDLANDMSVSQVTSAEASFALGALGFKEALGPLLREAGSGDDVRKLNGAIALTRLSTSKGDRDKVRSALRTAYGALPKGYKGVAMRGQLLGAMAHTYDPELLPTILDELANKKAHPDLRLIAARNYAQLANKADAAKFRSVVSAESKSEAGGYREKFQAHMPLLKVADECDKSVGCWAEKSKASNPEIARKATYMLGRYGAGNKNAVDALVAQLSSEDLGVRLGALMALDHVATKGSAAAVAKIDELREKEEGRSIWTRFRAEALPVQARLRSRAGG